MFLSRFTFIVFYIDSSELPSMLTPTSARSMHVVGTWRQRAMSILLVIKNVFPTFI